MKMTHAKMWKEKPGQKTVFVSNYMNVALPVLGKTKTKKVLDVACGNGLGVTLPLLREGYNVWCFDHFKSGLDATIKNAKKEGFKINARKADMYKKFPYPDNFFDACFCFQAIYHGKIEQIMFTLSEMKRVTKNNGLVFVTFLPYEDIHYDKKSRKHFIYYSKEDNTYRKSYMKQDKAQPHLFYFLGGWEPGVPHYFISHEELAAILPQFLENIGSKKVSKKKTDKWFFRLYWGHVRK